MACKEGLDDIVSILIDRTEVEQLTESVGNQNTPLHLILMHKEEKLSLALQILNKIKLKEQNYLSHMILHQMNHNKYSILQIAIDNNHMQIIEAIIKDFYPDYNQADSNGNLPIHLAADNGSIPILNILFKYKAVSLGLNSKNENPLHIAATKNRFQFIEKFLKYEKSFLSEMTDKGVDLTPCVQQFDCNMHTPLFSALIMDNLKSLEIFANCDEVDSNATDKDGNTVIHVCAQFNNVESLRYLLKNSAFVETIFLKNNLQETPLHVAGRHGNIEIFKLILEKFYDGKHFLLNFYLISIKILTKIFFFFK
jgi:ankyrin repeat protein